MAAKNESKYKHPQKADRTKEQHSGRRCIICAKNGAQIAHNVFGEERWYQLDEHGHEWVCHACYHKKTTK